MKIAELIKQAGDNLVPLNNPFYEVIELEDTMTLPKEAFEEVPIVGEDGQSRSYFRTKEVIEIGSIEGRPAVYGPLGEQNKLVGVRALRSYGSINEGDMTFKFQAA